MAKIAGSLFLMLVVLLCVKVEAGGGGRTLFVFGDSLFDAGNNQYINKSSPKTPSSHWPYGHTFFKHPTGRISDGRIVPDFIGPETTESRSESLESDLRSPEKGPGGRGHWYPGPVVGVGPEVTKIWARVSGVGSRVAIVGGGVIGLAVRSLESELKSLELGIWSLESGSRSLESGQNLWSPAQGQTHSR